jgi:hypothetical protein
MLGAYQRLKRLSGKARVNAGLIALNVWSRKNLPKSARHRRNLVRHDDGSLFIRRPLCRAQELP